MNTNETYNGWTNYETWNMGLILSNEKGLYDMIIEFIEERETESVYEIAKQLKEYIENNYAVDDYNIIRVDCESWTLRDFQEINFVEIVENFKEK